jgi:hypothetical protein
LSLSAPLPRHVSGLLFSTFFFEILSCGSKYWRQAGESAGFRTLVWRYCVAQVLA